MAGAKLYLQVAIFAILLVAFSEQCNVGLGNLGLGNIGVGNIGFGNKGVMNRGFKTIGVLNRKSANTIGVGNFGKVQKIGVASVIAVPNFMPTG